MTGYDGGVRRLLVLVTALSGCRFSAPEGGGEFACSAAAPECPPGTACVDGRCTAAEAADAALPPAGFSFRQKLTFDNREHGTVAGFPLLVALDARVFDYGGAAGDGSDLRFFDPDQTPLPHEIETWDTGGPSVLWVRVPEVTGNSDQDFIWLYYGHPDPPAPPAGDVWSAYQMVHHLGAGLDDSAALELEGEASGTELVAGQIGRGRRFDGIDDHIEIGPDPPVLRAVPGMTLEAWVARAQPPSATDQVVIAVTAHGADFSRAQIKIDTAGSVRAVFRTQDTATPNSVYTLDKPLAVGEWTWVVVSVDLTCQTIRIAINGIQQVGATSSDLDPITVDTSPKQVLIAIDETDGERYAGVLDEVRIAGATTSQDWLAVQYASMTGGLVGFELPEQL